MKEPVQIGEKETFKCTFVREGHGKSMENIITRDEAIAIAKEYAAKVRENIDGNAEVYLFGSSAKGNAQIGSDIDIAVVSKVFGDAVVDDFVKVNMLAYKVSYDIEAHPIVFEDWVDVTPFTIEIKRHGVAV